MITAFTFRFDKRPHGRIRSGMVVLDGELAVPCNPQPAIAGSNSSSRTGIVFATAPAVSRPRVSCGVSLRIGSGPEGSSPKWYLMGATSQPATDCRMRRELVRYRGRCTASTHRGSRRAENPGASFFPSARVQFGFNPNLHIMGRTRQGSPLVKGYEQRRSSF